MAKHKKTECEHDIEWFYEILNFKEWFEEIKPDLKINTKKSYYVAIRQFLIKRPDLLDQKEYNMFLVEKTKGKEGVKSDRKNLSYYYTAIKYYLSFLKSKKYIDSYKFREMIDRLPKPNIKQDTKREKPTSMNELKLIIKNLMLEKHKLIASVMRYTGLRIGTVLSIERPNIEIRMQGDNPHIAIKVMSKGGKMDHIYIYDQNLAKELIWFAFVTPTDTDYIFLDLKTPFQMNYKQRTEAARAKNYFEFNEDHFIIKNLDEVEKHIELKDSEKFIGKKIYLEGFFGTSREEVLEHIFPLIMNNSIYVVIKGSLVENLEQLIKCNYNYFDRDWKKASEMLGLTYKSITAHSFRRTYARFVWDLNKDLDFLQKQLLHARPDTTLRYLSHSGLQRKERDLKVHREISQI